jgi:hypothetical protein
MPTINGTQVRVIFLDGLTGAKFGMKIQVWTHIGSSCLGLLQTKTMSNINEENYVLSHNINEEK